MNFYPDLLGWAVGLSLSFLTIRLIEMVRRRQRVNYYDSVSRHGLVVEPIPEGALPASLSQIDEIATIIRNDSEQAGTRGYETNSDYDWGFSGYSGYRGMSGFSGVSGFSGTSGAVGVSGFSGVSGVGTTSWQSWQGPQFFDVSLVSNPPDPNARILLSYTDNGLNINICGYRITVDENEVEEDSTSARLKFISQYD